MGRPNFDDANVGVGTTMPLILVGFYCELACVLTLQNFINKHIKKIKKKKITSIVLEMLWGFYKYPSAFGFSLWNPIFSYD